MGLSVLRRRGAPVGILCVASYVLTLVPPAVAHAAEEEAHVSSSRAATETVATEQTVAREALKDIAEQIADARSNVTAPVTGGDHTGVSSQAISVPQGAGKIQGMGESFSMQLSTGVAGYSVPIALPRARGAVQPALALSYSSAAGHGIAGVGWDLAWPSISRQTDRGIPKYDDRSSWHPEQDRFVFNGGQELVPICRVASGACADAILPLPAGEQLPAWAEGWQYFRPRVEGSYLRFFWSSDHRTWIVQSKAGDAMELGVPQDGSGYAGALETDPSNAGHVFRWNLARHHDAQRDSSGNPVNTVVYRYMPFGGTSYLADVYDTSPASDPTATALAKFAHHVHLVYRSRPDATFSYRRGWRVDQSLRLEGVDVASKSTASGAITSERELVRRYHLTYDANYHASLLVSVQLEGRCGQPVIEDALEQRLPNITGCPMFPPVTFSYQHVSPFATDGSPGTNDLPGFEGIDARVRAIFNSPPNSLDDQLTMPFDVNADGLPDVVVTAPGIYGGKHAAFINGAGGKNDTFGGFQPMSVGGVPGEDENVIKLSNPNIALHDLDGDGVVDLLHMPKVKTYSVYSPVQSGSTFAWQGRAIKTASQQSPKIDFAGQNPAIKVMDVNGDGLVDVVFSSGTEYQTFFSLGRYPGGDGQFGSGTWLLGPSASIQNDPVTSCLPWSATPALLSDDDVRVGDMNGDGLPDIVRVRAGDVRYWPGRGNGFWGIGDPKSCPAGGFGQSQHVAMASSPQIGVTIGESLLIDDVNGDGLDDLVKVHFDSVDVWLNVDGASWTDRHVILSTPPRPPPTNRVRLIDINGSGTRDIVWGDGGNYRYIDLAGGQRPWVLTHVDNGLGKTTDIEYSTSTALMLADEASGQAWTSKAPTPIHVVSKVTEHDNLEIVGRPAGAYVTQYTYRDAVYDGRQREFRGFRSARAKRIGDGNSPTAITSSTFLLGECKDDEPPPGGASSRCSPDGRWTDNPREALKGLPTTSETLDETGVYLSTVHNTYTLRKLYTGLDGREVRVAFKSATDAWTYDTAPFNKSESPSAPADVLLELTPGSVTSDTAQGITLRSASGRAHVRSESHVDQFGNSTDQVSYGCVDGCPVVDERITTHTVPDRPSGDTSGWLWRTVETWVEGADQVRRKHTATGYDPHGNPTTTLAMLAGTLPLDRFHEDASKQVAPPPLTASVDAMINVSSTTYNTFGEPVMVTAPNHRCRSVSYASDYSDLAVAETLFVGPVPSASNGNGCGSTALFATAEYDRGLGATVAVHDLHGELTRVAYDGFGRLAAVLKPNPSNPTSTSAVASVLIDYDLAKPAQPSPTPGGPTLPARPYSIVHTQVQDGADDATPSYRETYALVDGLGRTIVTLDQADPTSGDGGQWIVNGLIEYDNKGAARRAYLPWFWNGDPRQYQLSTAPTTAYSRQRYDAFGRPVQSFGLDGTVALQSAFHALSVDKWDAADLQPGPHQGTYASARQDGHGRTVSTTERIHVGAQVEARETQTQYLPSGEPIVIARVRGNDRVVRWLRYDTLGRLVLNVEPNTTKGFSPDSSTDPGSMKAWRYAYDDNGELVGTSDARGCGVNYSYDAGGRVVSEDYSPCTRAQQDYSAPDLTSGDGVEVFYRYDFADPSAPSTIDDCSINGTLLLGRLASVSDRASKTLTSFDGRGRSVCVARQVAKPGFPDNAIANRYAPRWYTQTVQYDGADRPIASSTGAKVPELLGAGGTSFVRTSYTKRGTVKSVAGDYGDLVSAMTRDADGLVQQIVYGDIAKTSTAFSYDQRRRLSSVQTYRGPPPIWSAQPAAYSPAPNPNGAPSTLQLLLEDSDFTYDAVDNPIEIRDWRMPSEWPAGAKPVTRKMQYDDLYRVTRVDYQYSTGDDTWVDPFAAEDANNAKDPRTAKPSPHLAFAKRVLSQSFQYDWLGNTTRTDDDAKGFYDRSLGTITNGDPSAGPYQLKGAVGGAAPRDGALTTAYDDAGNLVGLSVIRNAGAPCVGGTSCSQRFAYEWDEVGRLARARRWDGDALGVASDPLPIDRAAAAELAYAYDADDDRVRKSATDAEGRQLHTVYIFDSLELRRSHFDGADFERSIWTEVPYLVAGAQLARVHYAANDVPTLASGQQHVLLELPDHLGSSAIVIDRATSELVERSTYQAYGAAESDYRPDRWDSYRDDYRFTGKEEDVELGIQYFGKRYYAPMLGRWVSPDPLAIHGLGADLNVYAYVHASPLRNTDPFGLADIPGGDTTGFTPGGYVNPDTGAYTPSDWTHEGTTIVGHADADAAEPSTVTGGGSSEPGVAPPVPNLDPNVARTLGLPATGGAFHNAQAETYARQGKKNLAVVWEAGLICLGCHITHFHRGTDDEVDLTWIAHEVQVAAYGHSILAVSSVVSGIQETAIGQRGRVIAEPAPKPAEQVPASQPAIPTYADGTFSITDWTDYPDELPRPNPVRLLRGDEKAARRSAANKANAMIRAATPELVGSGLDIHEIQPVVFDGDPIDPINKTLLERAKHTGKNGVHPKFWAPLQRWVEEANGK